MESPKKLLPTRIVIWSFLIGLFVIGFTIYSQYSTEINQEVTNVIVDALPNIDQAVAKL